MRAVVAVAGLLVILVGGGVAMASSAGPTVEITDRLEPPAVTVPVGSTVRWHNADDERHRLRSESGPEEFDSGNLEPSATWSETFAVPGEYRYVDARNPDEPAYWGSVTVTDQGGSGAAPSEDGAPSSSEPGSAAPDAGRGGQGPISMGDRSFAPERVAVPVGTTVTWANDSDRDHTVTADDGSFDSGELPPGARFSHTFAQAGSYGYFCAFHGGMRGTVVVGDAADGEDANGEATGDGPVGARGRTTDASSSPGGTALAPDIGAGPGEVDVEVRDFAFDPESVEVAAGSTVTWRHVGDAPHTVTAADGSFDSGMIDGGDTFSHTFDEPGGYRYVCELHPQMVAEVTVGDGGDAEVPGPVTADAAGEEPSASTGASGSQAPGGAQTVAASPSTSSTQGVRLVVALLVAGVLVSASVLVGADRVGRAIRGSTTSTS